MSEYIGSIYESDEVHGEDSGVDFRRPIAEHHDKVAERSNASGLDVQIKIDDKWVSVNEQHFEPGDEPGTLKRLIYNHKKEAIVVGVVAVGSIITALAASRYVAKKHKN